MLLKDKQQIGIRLYTFRKQKGLTQADVADIADISDRTYADIERGSSDMRVTTLCSICDALGITPDDLLSDDIPVDEMTEELFQTGFSNCSYSEKKICMQLLAAYLQAIRRL